MKSAAIHRDHAAFRQVLHAMSHPGTVCSLTVPVPINSAHATLVQLLGCLMDNEVAFSVIGDETGTLATALSLHTGSSQTDIGESDFIIATRGATDGQLSLIKRGTLEYPDKGSTLVYLVDEIVGEGGTAELSGPGIKGTVSPLFMGLAATELAGLREVNAEYPLGVDAIVLDTYGRIACIPRSTRIGEY
jgi:alpha-D-ribose 1-methylphosphonate 5-triphosphate synthase subunit PhnH